MKKIKIFDKLNLEKEQEKWLFIGAISLMLVLVFYVVPIALGFLLIEALITTPIMRLIPLFIWAVTTLLAVHYTFRYGFRACVRLAINDYEIRQRKKREKEEKEGLEHG